MFMTSQVHHKALSLGEVLDGDRMAESLYNIHFRENTEKKTLCHLTLSEKEVAFSFKIHVCMSFLLDQNHGTLFVFFLCLFYFILLHHLEMPVTLYIM